MTVTYLPKMATIKFVVTLQILMRWKGSLYKLVLPDLAIFCSIYTLLSVTYRFFLTETQRQTFEIICQYSRDYSGTTTVTFCLGFFVSYILGRWWECFKTMPWVFGPAYHIRHVVVPPFVYKRWAQSDDHLLNDPTDVADGNFRSSSIGVNQNQNQSQRPRNQFSTSEGDVAQLRLYRRQFEEAMNIRLTVLRYLIVSWILLIRRISNPVLVRFKPQKNLADCTLLDKLKVLNCDPFIQKYFPKLLTDTEIEAIIAYAKALNGDNYEKYEPDFFLTLDWAADLVHMSRARGYIPTDHLVRDMLQTLREYRTGLGGLRLMDMFNVPLVYTQVVSLCLYIYLALNCFAQQFTDQTKPDVYVPVPFILQMAFLFGWLRVSEVCLNPFGEDDDDFNTWQILNMNLEASYRTIKFTDLDIINDLYASSNIEKNAVANSVTTVPTADVLPSRAASFKRRFSTQSARNYSVNYQKGHYPSVPPVSEDYTGSDDYRDKKTSVGQSVIGITLNGDSTEAEEADCESTLDDSYRAYDYERMKKMYDGPAFLGSALENALGSKTHLAFSSAPSRAVSILNFGLSRLISTAPQTEGSPVSSKLNLVGQHSGSKTNVTSSRIVLNSQNTDENHPLHALLNVQETSET